MKFVIPSAVLGAHLQTVGRVIVQKNTLPILDCFCFDIKGDKLTVTASDNDSMLTTTMDLSESDADVRFAVNAKTLQDAIKELPDQPLDIYFNPDTLELVIDYQNGQYKLMAQSAEEWPSPTVNQEPVALTLTQADLLNGLTRALIAAANDQLRPQLNAVCFDIDETSISVVACNGDQLAMTQFERGTNAAQGTFLLGSRPSALLKGVLGRVDGDVVMHFGDKSATFETSGYTMTCRLVEGRYPNYRGVIPQGNPHLLRLNRQALISVLRRILVFAVPGSVLVRLELSPNSLLMSSRDVEFGMSAEETILCEYNGPALRIAFKGSALLELLQNIDGEDVTFQLSDPSRAGVIVPSEQKEGEKVLMLLMPRMFPE